MAFGHGKDELVFVNGYNLTGYLNSAAASHEKDTAEVTPFGVANKTYLSGLRDGVMSLEGYFDGAASACDEYFHSILEAAADKAFVVWPQGDAFGALGRGMLAQQTSYEITGNVASAVGVSVEAQSDGGLHKVSSLHSYLTDVTGDGNGTTEDSGAQTTNGGYVYVQCLSKSGGTSLDIEIHDSNDNFVGDDNLIASLSVSAAGDVDTFPISGTIERYVRAEFDETGGGTWNVSIAFYRAL